MTREQDRARLAYDHILSFKDKPVDRQKVFATVIHQLTTLLKTAGVVQALSFVDAYTNKEKQAVGKEVLRMASEQAKRVVPSIANGDGLLEVARTEKDLRTYMLLGRELIASLVWYRRLMKPVLGIDIADVSTEDED